MKAKARKFLLVLFGMVFALTILEIGLRLAGSFYKKRYRTADEIRPDAIPILCLGESSTSGLWVPPQDSYPKQLERILNEHYKTDRIQTIVPFHMGQNSSQIANRIQDYLDQYKPALVIAMIGINNEWSFAENNFIFFLKGNDSTTWKLRLEAWSDRFRVLKVARFAYKKYVTGDSREGQPSGSDMMAGQPEYTSYPPEEWKWKLGMQNQDALLAGWRQDVHNIAIRSKKMNSKMILMNYHMNAPFMNTKAVQEMAQKEAVPFLNNEELWQKEAVATNRTKQLLMHDGWHPNPEGYGLIAGNVFQLIRSQDLLGLE